MKVLIFPATAFESIVFGTQLKKQGHFVIGASSVNAELAANLAFDENIYISHITTSTFITEFIQVLEINQITHFWTSVDTVHNISRDILKNRNIESLNCDPMDNPLVPLDIIIPEVQQRQFYMGSLAHTLNSQSVNQQITCSMLFNTLAVPGQSHFDKLLTICSIFSIVPKHGDIVEIGSLWGRSAFLFSLLSMFHQCGNVLCIDPWPNDGIAQNLDNVLEEYSVGVDSSVCFSHFCFKLSSLFLGKINYIRDYSQKVVDKYTSLENDISTPEFGAVAYKKEISLLHIDGNHGYESVKLDVKHWCPLVISGGWIIFDDYNWAYGGGPKEVIDDYLQQHCQDIEFAFYSGGALFVKKY